MKLLTTIRYIKIANNITEMSSHGQYAKIGLLQYYLLLYACILI